MKFIKAIHTESPIKTHISAGFTLVELSIVLVIIGLLIGGILVGQSLIENARLNALVRQISQYSIAINTFRSKYGTYPGDSKHFERPGDGDGKVYDLFTTGADSSLYNNEHYAGEILHMWKHLYDSKTLNEKFTYTNVVEPITAGTNCPSVDIGDDSCIIAGTAAHTHHVFPVGSYLLSLRRDSRVTVTYRASAEPDNSTSLTTMEALTIDSKMDDGIANSGNVRASNGERFGLTPTLRNSGCVATDISQYDINSGSTATHCALSFFIPELQ